jgi:hypothetical protein
VHVLVLHCAWILFAKKSSPLFESKPNYKSFCNCGWLKSRKQVEPVLTLFLQQTGLKNQTGLKLPPNRFDFLRV